MVQLNSFEVEVVPKKGSAHEFSKYTDDERSWYIEIPHETEYKLRLTNNRKVIADAVVKMEGQKIGKWRVNANDSIEIERPSDIMRKFTFLAEGTKEAAEAGIHSGDRNNGLIEVIFYPKKESKYVKIPAGQEAFVSTQGSKWLSHQPRMMSANVRSNDSMMTPLSAAFQVPKAEYRGGSTVLGGTSDQHFGSVHSIPENEIDRDNVTTIMFRLVAPAEKKTKQTGYPAPI
jgi:hypothetical protein